MESLNLGAELQIEGGKAKTCAMLPTHQEFQRHTVVFKNVPQWHSESKKQETYCSLTTKMQLSCEGKPETGCLQVTFRSL